MPAGEGSRDPTTHRDTGEVNGAGDMQTVEQLLDLTVIHLRVVRALGTIGPTAPVLVIAKYAITLGREGHGGGIPDVIGHGESVDEDHRRAAIRAEHLVVRHSVGEADELPRGGASRGVIQGMRLRVASQVERVEQHADHGEQGDDDRQRALHLRTLMRWVPSLRLQTALDEQWFDDRIAPAKFPI
jgi:hypothetical protein